MGKSTTDIGANMVKCSDYSKSTHKVYWEIFEGERPEDDVRVRMYTYSGGHVVVDQVLPKADLDNFVVSKMAEYVR